MSLNYLEFKIEIAGDTIIDYETKSSITTLIPDLESCFNARKNYSEYYFQENDTTFKLTLDTISQLSEIHNVDSVQITYGSHLTINYSY